jgi:hypothetical protein
MLISLIALVAVLLSSGIQFLSAGKADAATSAKNPLITPEDPSTLTLALIAAGTLAVYVVARHGLRRRGRSTAARDLTGHLNAPSLDVAEGQTVCSDAQRPSRGAA